MTDNMTITPVQSSVLAAIGYSPDAVLELRFRNGAIYHYLDVPRETYQGLSEAESKGTFFNRRVRNHFRYHRLA